MRKIPLLASVVVLGTVFAAMSPAQTYTLVSTVPVHLVFHSKVYKRTVIGLAYPIGILEEHQKLDECSGSDEACPWDTPWASIFNNFDPHYYLGYSGGGVVPAGRIYKWFYEYDFYLGTQKWSRTIQNEIVYYERLRMYDDNITALQLEDVDGSAPTGGGS